jgi:hypothetical protein
MEQPPPPPPQIKSDYEKFVQQISVLMLREPQDLQQKLAELRELYRPANTQEHFYLNHLAGCQLTMLRLKQLESGLFELFIDHAMSFTYPNIGYVPEPLQSDSDFAAEQRRNLGVADGFKNYTEKGDVLPFFFRFLTLGERNLRRAQEQFDRIRKQRLTPTLPQQPVGPLADGKSKPKVRLLTSNGKSGPKLPNTRARRPGKGERMSLGPALHRASRAVRVSHRTQLHRHHSPLAGPIAQFRPVGRQRATENRGQSP